MFKKESELTLETDSFEGISALSYQASQLGIRKHLEVVLLVRYVRPV